MSFELCYVTSPLFHNPCSLFFKSHVGLWMGCGYGLGQFSPHELVFEAWVRPRVHFLFMASKPDLLILVVVLNIVGPINPPSSWVLSVWGVLKSHIGWGNGLRLWSWAILPAWARFCSWVRPKGHIFKDINGKDREKSRDKESSEDMYTSMLSLHLEVVVCLLSKIWCTTANIFLGV